ncbi:DsbE family thiol:disulfide interchange protein [Rhizobiaceae bacterium]|nr:DsbE family thiol:disulfide interchange protein [Rhizobiaceae bacterium]
MDKPPTTRAFWFALPVVVFAALAIIFAMQLTSGRETGDLPSVLIGKAAPEFMLPPLEGMNVPGLTRADLVGGKPTLVNIFASWCAPCRAEHPVLLDIARGGEVAVVGIAYKDKPENTRAFLTELGNPFAHIGVDERGRAAIDWGFYGVPETFLVDAQGVIRHKVTGALDAKKYDALVAKLKEL